MTLLYISAAKGDIKNNRSTIVRIERLETGGEEVRYYLYPQECRNNKAKLKALATYLSDGQDKAVEGITIFLDNEDLAKDWNAVLDDDSQIKDYKEWTQLRALLVKGKFAPQVKSTGFLSDSARSELKLYIDKGGL